MSTATAERPVPSCERGCNNQVTTSDIHTPAQQQLMDHRRFSLKFWKKKKQHPSNTEQHVGSSRSNAFPSSSEPNRNIAVATPQHASLSGTQFFPNATKTIINNPVMQSVTNNNASDTFMTDFAKRTIAGAAFDSSARDPPPRCHPGTRLATVGQARNFYEASERQKRVLWIVGPAGVGKSAIMQTVAETSPSLGASLFFSVQVRDDPAKVMSTLAYQIATKHPQYRDHIRTRIMADPTLLEKSMSVQFEEFITDPFTRRSVSNNPSSLLIILDGLDECSGIDAQCKLIRSISEFAIRYPSAPLLWIIASRPEPHLTACFGRAEVLPSYNKIELVVDSDESRADVERFLRNELEEIRQKYPALSIMRQWPLESDFLKLAAAANGLFAYASTATRFIDDPAYGHPSSQLRQVLEMIDVASPAQGGAAKTNPMALLDALYERILASIPSDVFPSTRKLLLASGILSNYANGSFYMSSACNWLGFSPDDAYAALHHLHSVLKVPAPNEAESSYISVHHKSFRDCLSRLYPQDDSEFKELEFECALRLLKDIPEDHTLSDSSDFSVDVILTWPRQEKPEVEPEDRRYFYISASSDLTQYNFLKDRLLDGDSATIHAMKVMALDSRELLTKSVDFPFAWLLDDPLTADALRKQHLLTAISVKTLKPDSVHTVRLCYSRYISTLSEDESQFNDRLNPKCDREKPPHQHQYKLKKVSDGRRVWSRFSSSACTCFAPVWSDIEYAQVHTPDSTATVFVGAHRLGLVVINSTDGGGEWTHVIPYRFPESLKRNGLTL